MRECMVTRSPGIWSGGSTRARPSSSLSAVAAGCLLKLGESSNASRRARSWLDTRLDGGKPLLCCEVMAVSCRIRLAKTASGIGKTRAPWADRNAGCIAGTRSVRARRGISLRRANEAIAIWMRMPRRSDEAAMLKNAGMSERSPCRAHRLPPADCLKRASQPDSCTGRLRKRWTNKRRHSRVAFVRQRHPAPSDRSRDATHPPSQIANP